MKSGVPFLNVLISIAYILVAALMLYILKLANRPLTKFSRRGKSASSSEEKEDIDYQRTLLISWFKKYSFVGAYFEADKKYLLKEFLFMSSYAVTSLSINRFIIWPIAFSSFLLPVVFITFEVLLKLIHNSKIEDDVRNKTKNSNQVESELEIESVNIETVNVESAQQLRKKEEEKSSSKVERTTV